MAPLRLALLGAGGFVRDAYLDPLKANQGSFLVKGLWSRSQASAEALVPELQRCAAAACVPALCRSDRRATYDTTTPPSRLPPPRFSPSCRPFHGDDGLQAVLATDVDAVLVALPPQVQGAVIQAALRAGEGCDMWVGAGCREAPQEARASHCSLASALTTGLLALAAVQASMFCPRSP